MTPATNLDSSKPDTRANYINPALTATSWNSSKISRKHYFTDGRKLGGGSRSTRRFVDRLFYRDNQHIAIIETREQSVHPTKYRQHRPQKLTTRCRLQRLGLAVNLSVKRDRK